MITEDNVNFRNNMDLIIPRKTKPPLGELWLGNLKSAKDVQTLKRLQVKTVITIVNNVTLSYTADDQIKHYVLQYLYNIQNLNKNMNINNIQIFQAPDVPQFKINELFETTIELIDQSLKIGGVLVHCVAGISRSATIVISYLMSTRGWGYEKAMYYVRERRQVNPNPGFLQQLIQFSKGIQQKLKNQNKQLFQWVKVTGKEDQTLQHNYFINQTKQMKNVDQLQDQIESINQQNFSLSNKTKDYQLNHSDEKEQLAISINLSQYDKNELLEIQKYENVQSSENTIKKSNEKIFKLEFEDRKIQQIQKDGNEIYGQDNKELTIKESIKIIAENKKNIQNYLNSGVKQNYNSKNVNKIKESEKKQSLITLLQSHTNQNKFKEVKNDKKQIIDSSQFINLKANEISKHKSDSIILDEQSIYDQNKNSPVFSKLPYNQNYNDNLSFNSKKKPVPIRSFATPDQKLNNIQNYHTPTLDDCSKFIDSIRQSSNSKINLPISSQRLKLERKRMQNDYPQIQLDMASKKLSIQQDLQYTQASFKSLNYQLGQKNNTENINSAQLQNSSKSIDVNLPIERFKKGTSAQQLYKIQKQS